MLAGKTIFVTGSSRGIGRAIALKCAKDGANVVIAAKTTEPHPKLPGTIYTVAKEVEEAGGRSLAVQLDLRDEDSIKNSVDKTVDKFGGIDILVNNASAISLSTVEDTPLKRYDLMHSINVRGTFAMSKYAIPHLLKSSNPHILTLSPPIVLQDCWFKSNTAYTMSKYGMSLCMFGLAAQLKGKVTVNALWPKTSIWTAAMDMLGGESSRKLSRKPSIMADAAYAIITKNVSTSNSGRFLIDEEVLRSEGVKDFEQYAEEPGNMLLPDFFLPDEIMKEFEGRENIQDKVLHNESDKGAQQTVDEIFHQIIDRMTDDVRDSINGVLQITITDHDLTYIFHAKKGSAVSVTREITDQKPDATVSMDLATFVGLRSGKIKPVTAFLSGIIKVKGKMNFAIKLEKVFSMELKSML